MNRNLLLGLLSVGVLLLTGCLFDMNLPAVAPDGSLYVFLTEVGAYDPFPEPAMLYRWTAGAWVPFSNVRSEEGSAVLTLSPDGTELLTVQVVMEGLFDPAITTIDRVAVGCPEQGLPQRVLETNETVVRVVWTEDGVWILTLDEEGVGQLGRLDLDTGQVEGVRSDVLSFLAREHVLLFSIEELADNVGLGSIGWWDPATDDLIPLITLVVTLDTAMSFMTLPHALLWDASRDGRYVALSVIENAFLYPPLTNSAPTLYLVDLEEEVIQRVALHGVAPAFSPDGVHLAYIEESDEGTNRVVLYALANETRRILDGTSDAQTIHWIAPDRMILTVDPEDGKPSLVELLLEPSRQVLTGGH